MKYKQLITIVLTGSAVAFVFAASFSMALAMNDIDSFKRDFGLPMVRVMCTCMGLLFFFCILSTVALATKVDTLEKIETQQEDLEKVKEKYKQATEELVKNYKIKSPNLL